MQNVCSLHAVLYPPFVSMYDPIIREIHEGVREGEKSRRKMGRKSTIKKRNGERRREKQKQEREKENSKPKRKRDEMWVTPFKSMVEVRLIHLYVC